MLGKVYITQENNKLDYSSATKYGKLFFITAKEFSLNEASLVNIEIKKAISDIVSKYDPKKDYILMSGDPVIFALVFHECMVNYGFVRLLKWDSREKGYHSLLLSEQNIKGDF